MKISMVSSVCDVAVENSPKSAPVGAMARTGALRTKRSRSTIAIPRTMVTRSMSRKQRQQLLDQVQTSGSIEIKKEEEQQEDEAFQDLPVQQVEKELLEEPLVQLEIKEEQPQTLMEVEEPQKQQMEQEQLVPQPMPQPEPEKERPQQEEEMQNQPQLEPEPEKQPPLEMTQPEPEKEPILEKEQLVPQPMPQAEQEARNEVAVEGNDHGYSLRTLMDFSMVQFLPITRVDEFLIYRGFNGVELGPQLDLPLKDVGKKYSWIDRL